MEIVGIGTDIVECLRLRRMIEQHGELFLERVFTPAEVRFCHSRKRAMEHFAGLWAAKEAVIRSLGTQWKDAGVWTDLEVSRDSQGVPRVALHGGIAELARNLGVGTILLSIGHCRAYAVAYATALRMAPSEPRA